MVPNLRFREFNDQLVYTSFENVMKLYRGSSPRPIINYVTTDKNGVNWIKIGDMPSSGNRVFSCSERITEEGSKKSRAVYKGDIILSNSMSFGKPYILEIDGFIHDGWFVIRDYQKYIDKTYLCQLLSSDVVQNQYKSTAAGGVVKNISSDLVNSVRFHLPSITEQRKIAKFLELIDQKIETQIKIINALDSQRKCIFLKSHRVSSLKKIKIVELGKMAAANNLSKDDLSIEGHDCILYGELFTKYNLYIDNVVSKTEKMNNAVVSGGNEILFPTSTTVDAISLIKPVALIKKGVILGGDMFSIKLKDSYNPIYISCLINFIYKRKFASKTQGSTIIHLHYSDIKNEIIEICDYEIQCKIANLIESITKKIKVEEELLNLLYLQKSYLLQNMFI